MPSSDVSEAKVEAVVGNPDEEEEGKPGVVAEGNLAGEDGSSLNQHKLVSILLVQLRVRTNHAIIRNTHACQPR